MKFVYLKLCSVRFCRIFFYGNYKVMLFVNILLSFIPVILGGLIYLCFRDEKILFFRWLRRMSINYSSLRQIDIGSGVVQSYIVYSLPHGLFIFFGMLMLGIIWRNRKKEFYIYASFLTIAAIFYEVSQKFGIIRGTFDIADLITIAVFAAAGILANAPRRKYEKY